MHTAAFLEVLAPVFGETKFGVAEENLQARTRGAILMAISNKFGPMVVATGNKSETGSWLRNSLWRHGGRVCGSEGCLQDPGLRAR